MKYINLIVILILTVSIFALDPVAITSNSEGVVVLHREETEKNIEIGEALINQDEIQTKEDSFCAIRFIDGQNLVRVFPNSIFSVNVETDDDKMHKNTFLQIGSIFARIASQTGIFTVETPSSVASVRGTRIIVLVDEDGNSEFYVIEGELEVRNKNDDNFVILGGGEYTSTSGTGSFQTDSFNSDDLPGDYQQHIEDEEEETDIFDLEIEDSSGNIKKIRFHLTD